MPYTITLEDLNWLEEKGHVVDPDPFVIPHGRKFYNVDCPIQQFGGGFLFGEDRSMMSLMTPHLSDTDLERYRLGMIQEGQNWTP